jgi:predicted DNA-binding ribbon-helix-helix protein
MERDFLGHRVTFRMDENRYQDLERIARKEGFSVSTVIRHLVNRFVEDRRRSGGVR